MPLRRSLSPPSSPPSPYSSRTVSSSSFLSSPSSQTSPAYSKIGKPSVRRFSGRVPFLPSLGRSALSTRKGRHGSRFIYLMAIALAFYLVMRLCRSYDGLGLLLHEAETWRTGVTLDDLPGIKPGLDRETVISNATRDSVQNRTVASQWAPETPGSRFGTKQFPFAALDEDGCSRVGSGEDVAVVVLTSSTETQASLQSYLDSGLRCFPRSSLLLFSEVDDVLLPPDDSANSGLLRIHSALRDIPKSIVSENEEFALQATLTTLRSRNLDASSFATHHQINKLQKWRLLPAVLHSFALRPKARWFVVVNSETYVSHHNLHLWLSSLNASEPQYRGGPLLLGSQMFGAIGAGIVLSGSAVQKLAMTATKPVPPEVSSQSESGADTPPSPTRRYPVRYSSQSKTSRPSERETYLSKWYSKLEKERWSDMVLAVALEDAGIPLNRSFPVLHSLNPWMQDWTENVWCRGKVTWGRMSGEMNKKIANIERRLLQEVRAKLDKRRLMRRNRS